LREIRQIFFLTYISIIHRNSNNLPENEQQTHQHKKIENGDDKPNARPQSVRAFPVNKNITLLAASKLQQPVAVIYAHFVQHFFDGSVTSNT
jgi:hypothetical protein